MKRLFVWGLIIGGYYTEMVLVLFNISPGYKPPLGGVGGGLLLEGFL